MSCTTILIGKHASYDGSPLVARNEDSSNGEFTPKRVVVVQPDDQPRTYRSVIGHLVVQLPDRPLRYTAVPNALPDEGIWGEAGINAANVAMSATETLTTNERVLGADPFVQYHAASGVPEHPASTAPEQAASTAPEQVASTAPEQAGGIGEEDFLTLVLPYIRTAREGVLRLGALLEQYGTYEMNGVAFSDADEIWWLETVGGHHWIAKRVPDDSYVAMPNQLGIDEFDLDDALGEGIAHLASSDLRTFIADHFLDLSWDGRLNPRTAFGSHTDVDHVYNTPRAWYIQRRLNPTSSDWNEPNPRLTPSSDDIPWSRRPERKLTIEDIKDVLSSHYQGTRYDPYSHEGTEASRHLLRPIGINRHSQLSILQVRPYRPAASRSIQWVAFASNPFNALVPLYTNIDTVPEYLGGTTGQVTTENFYWASRILAALADAHFDEVMPEIERYQQATLAAGHVCIRAADAALKEEAVTEEANAAAVQRGLEAANAAVTAMVRSETDDVLNRVLLIASNGMRNRFSRSDG